MYPILKKVFDKIFALMLLVITLPIILLCLIIVRIEDKAHSSIFKQKRIGKNNKEFYVYKIRTMRGQDRRNLSDIDRLLKSGKILRKLSLDELPQLINILKGEMSFIGPRPLPPIYLPYYTKKELNRHNVLPGISGLAQVSGRNFLLWDDRLELDVQYAQNISFFMDLKIFLITIKKVFMRSDVGVRGEDFPDVSLHEIRQKRNENSKII